MTKCVEEERQKLFKMWQGRYTQEEIQSEFPDRTWKALQRQCVMNKIKRKLPKETFPPSKLNPWYVTGLIDGEGYFACMTNIGGKGLIGAKFGIKMRADDELLVEEIRNFFQCGTIYDASNGNQELREKYDRRNAKKAKQLEVFRREHLTDIIIPHFDKYPLQGKKRTDFEIWKELVYTLNMQKRGTRNEQIYNKLLDLANKLRSNREFEKGDM